jgi:magnesium transporter
MKYMAIEKFKELLAKQKREDEVVRRQRSARHELEESLVNKQHDAELIHAIQSHTPAELAEALDGLCLDDARALWARVPESRVNDVLWELSDERRDEIADGREPELEGSKVSVFELVDGRLRQVPISAKRDLAGVRPIWVDLIHASKAERAWIGAHFQVSLPDPLDVTDLEVSARFHIEENDAVHLHSNFLLDRAGDSRSVPVAFVLHRGILFSLRDEELPVFRLQKRLARTQPGYVNDAVDVLLDLYGADVEISADSLENIYAHLGKIGRLVLNETVSDEQAAAILADIAEEEDQNGRIRSNILDTQRALNFLMRGRLLLPGQLDDARQILRNIDSLNSHTAFLFDKINFLMDATIGFININQNKRVNQLTVFSVVFMPINILAGVGGMSEFSMMTEGIPWPLAYGGFALGSALIGCATYLGLKHFERRRLRSLKSSRF